MRFPSPPRPGRFRRRYQRFFAEVEVEGGGILTAHCPNTGSLRGCLIEGAPVWLRDSGNPARKLRFTWQAIRIGRAWVNVDTSLPNRVVGEALSAGRVPGLAPPGELRREVPYGRSSRIDLYWEDNGRAVFVEVKGTTLVEGRRALFPDAVTERGRKHLDELAREARRGARSVQFFLVNRDDADGFAPADEIDREYGKALRRAVRAGVEVQAWTCRVRPRELALQRRLEIDLPPLPRRRASRP